MGETRETSSNTDAIDCPSCGYVMRDLWELDMGDEDYEEHQCDECGARFILRCRIERWYRARLCTPIPEPPRG